MSSNPTPAWVLRRRREVGDRIRAIRTDRGLTQEKLGERCGMDRIAMNRIEGGHQSARLDTLIRIADALGVPLRSLFS